jgi:hypothetical protein
MHSTCSRPRCYHEQVRSSVCWGLFSHTTESNPFDTSKARVTELRDRNNRRFSSTESLFNRSEGSSFFRNLSARSRILCAKSSILRRTPPTTPLAASGSLPLGSTDGATFGASPPGAHLFRSERSGRSLAVTFSSDGGNDQRLHWRRVGGCNALGEIVCPGSIVRIRTV